MQKSGRGQCGPGLMRLAAARSVQPRQADRVCWRPEQLSRPGLFGAAGQLVEFMLKLNQIIHELDNFSGKLFRKS